MKKKNNLEERILELEKRIEALEAIPRIVIQQYSPPYQNPYPYYPPAPVSPFPHPEPWIQPQPIWCKPSANSHT